MGIFKKKKSAREESKEITDGAKPPKHLGRYSYEMLSQELIALCQTKPAFRDGKWRKRARTIRAEILSKIANGKRRYQPMILELNKIEEMR